MAAVRWSSIVLVLAGTGLSASGCALWRPKSTAAANNPVFIRANNGEQVWERTIDVVHGYLFEIERENRLNGLIETRYKTGASCLEPWHPDSVGAANRLESTLQSIRRKAHVSITPAQGGYFIGVEVFKEIEDAPATAGGAGAATFSENDVLRRDTTPVVKGQATSTWVARGRDVDLEQSMLSSVIDAFSR